jgi:NitT/TauT family transport system ATP-binding protein
MALKEISIKNLIKSYASPEPILSIPSLHLRAGQLTCILGPTGCGKTTLLNILSGLDPHFRGKIIGNGARISYQFQNDLLLPWKSVHDNLLISFQVRNEKPSPGLAEKWLKRLGLERVANDYPATLSAGMRQRLALGRTLASDGDLNLLDEPLSAQDFARKLDLEYLLRTELRKPGVISVMVTHNLEEAVVLADRIIVLAGRPAQVTEDFAVIDLPEDNRPLCARQSAAFGKYVSRAAKGFSNSATTLNDAERN